MPRLLSNEKIIKNRLTAIEELKEKGLWFNTWEERAAARERLDFLRDLYVALENGNRLTSVQQAFLDRYPDIDVYRTYEENEAKYFSVLRAMAQHDLTAYHEYMNPMEIPAKHHRFLCDYLHKIESGEIRTLLISMPPGSAKSTYASRSFIQWYLGRNPWGKILSGGYNINFVTTQFSRPNRETINSDEYRSIFPDVEIDTSYRSMLFWKLKEYGGQYAVRAPGSGTSGLRADLVVLDDVIGGKQIAASRAEREKINEWFLSDVMPRMLPGARLVLIGTRWHSHDLMGMVEASIKEDPESYPQPAEIINIPARCGPDNPLLPDCSEQEWLWEEFYGKGHYISIQKTMDSATFSATYLGKPIDAEGIIIQFDEIVFYDELPDEPLIYTVSVDTAQKSTPGANRTAIVVFARTKDNNNHYIVDAMAIQNPLLEVLQAINRMITKHKAASVLIEDAAMGTQIIENYTHSLKAPVIPISPQKKGSKEFEAETYLAPWLRSGKLMLPKRLPTHSETPWLADLLNEILSFPTGDYDDYVDACSQYCRFYTRKGNYGVKKLEYSL